jgi:hypothetical protein
MSDLNRLSVLNALHGYNLNCDISVQGDVASCEFGGELPVDLVSELKSLGAEVLRYGAMGVFATVVNF